MKYPAIIRNDNEIEMLLLNEDSAIILSEAHKGQVHDVFPRFRRRYVDITHEYLSNTWGVVESKEHAEFIIELTKLHGLVYAGDITDKARAKCFMIYGNKLELYPFCHSKLSNEGDKEQITIPLPPKAKEWPQVGDEVEYRGAKFKVLMTADKSGHIVVDDNGNYINPHIEDIKKPKSKQDLLIEELQTKLCNNNAVDNYILACDIINGEIEGLSYDS
jgi:hypothetical protein